jgi:hypothetical protein
VGPTIPGQEDQDPPLARRGPRPRMGPGRRSWSGALPAVAEPGLCHHHVPSQSNRLRRRQRGEEPVSPAEDGVLVDPEQAGGLSNRVAAVHGEAEAVPAIDALEVVQRGPRVGTERPLAPGAPVPLSTGEATPAVDPVVVATGAVRPQAGGMPDRSFRVTRIHAPRVYRPTGLGNGSRGRFAAPGVDRRGRRGPLPVRAHHRSGLIVFLPLRAHRPPTGPDSPSSVRAGSGRSRTRRRRGSRPGGPRGHRARRRPRSRFPRVRRTTGRPRRSARARRGPGR